MSVGVGGEGEGELVSFGNQVTGFCPWSPFDIPFVKDPGG